MAEKYTLANVDEVEDLLAARIAEFNIYDLERLRQCFTHELRFHPDNAVAINDILDHINAEIDRKASG